MKRNLAASFLVLILAFCCQTGWAQQPPRFINLVTVGDSLSAGLVSGVLKEDGQIRGYPALIARQVGTFHFLPLMPDPGVGQEIKLVNGELVMGPQTGGTSSRGFPLIVPQNLAIPGHDIIEALVSRPDFTDASKPFENLILGVPFTAIFQMMPVSQIELAVGLQPTFTLFWLGSNDVLKVATSGGDATPLPMFQAAYQQALGALLTLTSSQIIVANVPDVTVIPFLTSAEEIAALAGAPLALIGPALGIAAGDFVRPGGAALVEAILTGQIAGPIPEAEVLRATRVAELRTLTAQMNGFIAAFAGQVGVPVVDINGILNEIDTNGFQLGTGQVLTTSFLGGIFSLDGVHPTYTGQALVANSFIERMNDFWGLQIPLVSIDAVAATDPLVGPPMPAATRLRFLLEAAPALQASAQAVLGADRSQDDGYRFETGQDPELREEVAAQSFEEYLQTVFRRIQATPGPMPLTGETRREGQERSKIPSGLRHP